MLNVLENKTNSMLRQNTTQDDNNRDITYQLAEDVDSQLVNLQNTLNNTVNQFNIVQHKSTSNINNPISQIIRILNLHTDTLQWLDQQSNMLEQKLVQTNNTLQQAQQGNTNIRTQQQQSSTIFNNNNINKATEQYTSSLKF